MELDDIKEEHSELTTSFESLFSDIIGKKEIETEEQILDNLSKPKKEKKLPEIDDSAKKLYKDVAKKLHPDKGGSEEDFKELNKRYKDSDYLGIIELAVENNIEVDVDEDEIETLLKSISKLNNKIDHLKTTLPYVWEHGSELQRKQVVATLFKHIGLDLNIGELSDEIKKMIGMENNLDSTK